MSVLPPRPRGPHLNAMRSFEAAARLGGFAAAAEELCVTPGAVSQQVKTLEDWIGAPLFERRSQGVRLTALGQGALADFSAAFDGLGTALHGLRAKAPGSPVHIAALPALAQRWLAPRLAQVRAAMPGQVISITALETPPNLQRDLFDLSFFFVRDPDPTRHEVLARDVIFPVCAPQVAQRLHTPEDLHREVLIEDASWQQDWPLWLLDAGLSADPGQTRAFFSLYAIAVDETLGGAGVMMGHAALIGDHLATGRLVRPFELETATGLHLVMERARAHGEGSAAGRVAALLRASKAYRD